MGIPLIASSPTSLGAFHRIRRQLSRNFVRVTGILTIGSCLIVAQLAAFLTALHRYETGLHVAPGTPSQWSPPGGAELAVGVFLTGQVLLLLFVTWKAHDANHNSVAPADSSGGAL
jgi:hypothetical protein